METHSRSVREASVFGITQTSRFLLTRAHAETENNAFLATEMTASFVKKSISFNYRCFCLFLQVLYSAGRERFPWHTSVISCREFLEKNLFVTHVVLRDLLYLWESE